MDDVHKNVGLLSPVTITPLFHWTLQPLLIMDLVFFVTTLLSLNFGVMDNINEIISILYRVFELGLGAAATLWQHCPQMAQRRCIGGI